jgi:hypothetical protein
MKQLLLDVLDELPDREAVEVGDEAEDDEDEEQARAVERAHELAELDQRPDAVLADRERHRAEGAKRRELHDDADDREQHVRDLLDEVEDGCPAAAELVQREAEQHREQQHLQDLALGERVDDGVRDDVEQEADRGLHLARPGVGGDLLGVERVRVDVHAGTGLDGVDHHQADDQRDRAHDLEVEEREAAGLADLLHVLHAGDADDDGAEDDRRDHHLDQLDEAVAERLHRLAGLRPEMAEDDADDDRGDHLRVERLVERLLGRGLLHGSSLLATGRRRRRPTLPGRRGAVRSGRGDGSWRSTSGCRGRGRASPSRCRRS